MTAPVLAFAPEAGAAGIRVRIAEIETVAEQIRRLRLVPVDRSSLPRFSGGAHVVLSLPTPERILRNPYSLMGDLDDTGSYQVSVLRTPTSRGGSAYIHEHMTEGDEITISEPVNLFPIDRRARRHLLIAGGIGITPFIAMAQQLQSESLPFELRYCCRDEGRAAYLSRLAGQYGSRVRCHLDSRNDRPDFMGLLENQPLGTHLYVCGPEPMIQAVTSAAARLGWPEQNVHLERFVSPPSGEPFTVSLAQSGLTIPVAHDQTILEALEGAGLNPRHLCRGGACGECGCDVVAADGPILHNDHILSPAERDAGRMMICVSRLAKAGGTLTLSL